MSIFCQYVCYLFKYARQLVIIVKKSYVHLQKLPRFPRPVIRRRLLPAVNRLLAVLLKEEVV